VGFDQVYVATNATDTAASINAKLAEGLHLVLTPGIYHLDAPIEVTQANTVVLGLGLATLVATAGNAVVEVGDVAGVRVAGILMQAGPVESPDLMRVGTEGGGFAGDAANPVVLSDIFARVGGPDGLENNVMADTMVQVHSGHVVGDNFWLWRADHSSDGAVNGGFYPVNHGLQVHGDDVTMYGLAVEHTLQDLTQWHGERGATYFYQSELPYDLDQADFGALNYTGYRVDTGVASHEAHGVGVYSFFKTYHVTVESGIVAPESATFVHPFSVFLSGYGTIAHVLNDRGDSTGEGGNQTAYLCE